MAVGASQGGKIPYLMKTIVSSSRERDQRPAAGPRAGFTLMEINIALMIMAFALTSLLALFPIGLQQANYASDDTAAAAFADMVFNGMRANAQTITNWTDWKGIVGNNGAILLGASTGTASPNVQPVTAQLFTGTTQIIGDGTPYAAIDIATLAQNGYNNGYLVKGQYLPYCLTFFKGSSPLIINASLQVSTRQFASVSNAPIYATSFVYMGM